MANPFLTAKPRPLILGHRGVPLLHQENTLAGMRRARDLGLDGVELDVFLTRDGEVVVFHDDTVDRLTGGSGRVQDMTWDQLSKLRIRRDLYMGKDQAGGDVILRYAREEPISLLEEVLSELGGKIAINIELKPAIPRWSDRHLGVAVAKIIRRLGLEDSVIVTSFDFFKLHALEREHPPIESGFAYDDDFVDYLPRWLTQLPELNAALPGQRNQPRDREDMIASLLDANAIGRWIGSSVVGCEHTLVTPSTIDRFHGRGMSVGAYTLFPVEMTGVRRHVPDAQQIELLHQLHASGLDWIETDDPERAQRLLDAL
ncbi:MAG: hypothetical protein IPK80_22505 [Nannocystis sp.]|jgi:glycerophosphoryl diester phosphodiesterase|nr:hypothetical protein [Nannocystis sp.]